MSTRLYLVDKSSLKIPRLYLVDKSLLKIPPTVRGWQIPIIIPTTVPGCIIQLIFTAPPKSFVIEGVYPFASHISLGTFWTPYAYHSLPVYIPFKCSILIPIYISNQVVEVFSAEKKTRKDLKRHPTVAMFETLFVVAYMDGVSMIQKWEVIDEQLTDLVIHHTAMLIRVSCPMKYYSYTSIFSSYCVFQDR